MDGLPSNISNIVKYYLEDIVDIDDSLNDRRCTANLGSQQYLDVMNCWCKFEHIISNVMQYINKKNTFRPVLSYNKTFIFSCFFL